jgi:acetyltransferase
VAIVGASQQGGRGTRVVVNLQRFGFAGRVFPINPKYDAVHGLPCYPNLRATPEPPDSVVIAIPAPHVLGVLEEAAAAGIRAAVIFSSGFGESAAGRERHAALERLAAERGMLICGPNCYGVFNVGLGAATYSGAIPEGLQPGPVGLVSQSGGLTGGIAGPLARDRGIGFSYLISCGNQVGVSIEDYLEFLIEDAGTRVVAAFVEGFKEPAKLRRLAERAAALHKPVVVMKVGRSEKARRATLAHTGSLAGTPEIVEAALRQWGVIQVHDPNELIETVALLATAADYAGGWRMAVLTGSGGECGHVCDVAAEEGIDLAPLAPATVERLRGVLPDFGTPQNPLDGTGTMFEDGRVFPALLDTLLQDPGLDVVAINLGADPPRADGSSPGRRFSEAIRAAHPFPPNRLIFTFRSLLGGAADPEVIRPLSQIGVAYLEGTATALQALRHLRDQRAFVARQRPRRPEPPPQTEAPSNTRTGLLSPREGAALLDRAGIPIVPTLAAADAREAVAAAEQVGYPVVLKIDSPDIPHKTDVGGVRLGCADDYSVQQAFAAMLAEVRERAPRARIDGVVVQPLVEGGVETLLGIQTDPAFGPAVVFGLGGVLAELLQDVAIRLPPLDLDDAQAMIAAIRGSALLRGARGRPPADVDALAAAIVRLGDLALEHAGQLVALDVNPLLVLPAGEGVRAVEWLIEFA